MSNKVEIEVRDDIPHPGRRGRGSDYPWDKMTEPGKSMFLVPADKSHAPTPPKRLAEMGWKFSSAKVEVEGVERLGVWRIE